MKWTKDKKWIVPLMIVGAGANILIYIYEHNWSALLWCLCASVQIGCLFSCERSYDKLKATYEEHIRLQEEHIEYLTNLDVMKELRQANTEARISAVNCYHYLKRIGQLKAEIEQLKILNRNLLHNQGKGVKNYAKHTNRRADKRRTASDFE